MRGFMTLLFLQNAAYIPQLARVPKEKWGISICTVDGQRFSIGDVHDKFTIQSTSKPITYALTLEELGTELVHTYQGREPSGRMFNEIVLDHNSKEFTIRNCITTAVLERIKTFPSWKRMMSEVSVN